MGTFGNFAQEFSFLRKFSTFTLDEKFEPDLDLTYRVVDRESIDLASFTPKNIRNFSIVAHIDHGKTTLSDKLLELTGTTSPVRDERDPSKSLDALSVEKERGITVKAHTVSLFAKYKGEVYLLNLIDTPGHVDFTYEVSRSLKACDGALLLIDASQGIQAQTVANFFLAFESDLAIIPVLNKVDMLAAEPERCLNEIDSTFGLLREEVHMISAKTGKNVPTLLRSVIENIPAPKGLSTSPFKALLFDNWFESHKGVVCLIRVVDGQIKKGDKITSAATNQTYEVNDAGLMYPRMISTGALYTGQVGYLVLGMRSTKEARVGDTFYRSGEPVEPLPGFKTAKPMVFAGLYPADGESFERLQDAIEKLTLNDASVVPQKETSPALGIGYRCGFLGLLHMDVFLQRLEEEYGVVVIATAPTVPYQVVLNDNTEKIITNPAEWPESGTIKHTRELMADATIVCPNDHIGAVMKLCLDRRGVQKDIKYIDDHRVLLNWTMPLAEIISEFFDSLKEITSGFASLDYEETGFVNSDAVKLQILLNGDPVDALASLVHRSRAYQHGKDIVEKLKDVIPRQMFVVAVQASLGNRVIARETIAALRKDVTAKCYGGDISRKRKLLDKQKEGKKRMKQIGRVEVPQDAFMAVLKK